MGRSAPGGGNSICKGPEGKHVQHVQGAAGKTEENEAREITGIRSFRGLKAVGSILDFILKDTRNRWRNLSRGAKQCLNYTFLVLQKAFLAVGYRKCRRRAREEAGDKFEKHWRDEGGWP